jgi:hypothetical protein
MFNFIITITGKFCLIYHCTQCSFQTIIYIFQSCKSLIKLDSHVSSTLFGGFILRIVMSNTYCVMFLFCFSSSCVYPMLPVFLDCLCLIVPSVFSNVYSRPSFILFSLTNLIKLVRHVLFTLFVLVCVLWCPTLIVLCFSSHCVPHVANFSNFFIMTAPSVFSNDYLLTRPLVIVISVSS